MKPSGNESLHCTDYEMVCDRKFSAALPPAEAPLTQTVPVCCFWLH